MKKHTRRSKRGSVPDLPLTVDDKHGDEKRVRESEIENEAPKSENEALKHTMTDVSSTSGADAQNMKEDYSERSSNQVSELKKKLDVLSQLSAKKFRIPDEADESHEIHKLKAQKVQLQCKLKLESMQFRLCKASLEKEILQLKREQRRTVYKMHVLLALNQRQKHVLQRKMEEALVVRKQLKRVLQSKEAATCKRAGVRIGQTARIQGLKHGIDTKVQLPKVGIDYERETQKMIDEMKKLELESKMIWEEKPSYSLQGDKVSVTESELSDLREEMAKLSGLIGQMNLSKAHTIQNEKTQVSAAHSSVSGSVGAAVHSSTSIGSSVLISTTDASETENSEQAKNETEKPAPGLCCSCSKKSLCKTLKCGCRAVGSSCGASCGCAISKCSNRDQLPVMFDISPQSETAEKMLSYSGDTEKAKSSDQDTMIPKDDKKGTQMNKGFEFEKQPLRDIGNITIKQNARKPGCSRRGHKVV
ncbi:unnamed protein product [Cuscuta campestris]|uniref:Tesmin/TSO1-like CXC domain-containing protein n=1 Tax=Cuscuta campestris TaxID=132261 RepID=A0A484KU67_9ASTE|nr:unnamed protein product [Cuscuta campestris]